MHPAAFARSLIALAVATVAVPAWAEPDVARAKDAYDRGVRAHAAGEWAAAARAFADADAIAPATASLEAALASAVRADDEVLGAELIDRAATRPLDPALAKTLDAAKRRFAGRTGKIRVQCNLSTKCLAAVDGAAHDAWRAIVVKTGAHTIVVQRDDEHFERLVDVAPDAVVTVDGPAAAPPLATKPVAPAPAPAKAKEAPREASGISPVWFFFGLGVTAAGGVLTTLSGIDAVKLKDRFDADGCAPGATGPRPSDCDARATDGESAQARTNVLLAITGAAAITTAITGAFFVRWTPAPSGSGAVASIGGRLP